MYRVIGADRKEYGPVSEEQLRAWIAQGRLNAQSVVRPEGSVGWRPLSDFPEFSAALSQATPPVYPASPLPPVATDNNKALASLIIGCVSLVCCQPAAIVSLILGIVALSETKSNPARPGRGLAIAGIAVSIAAIIFMAVLWGVGIFGELIQKLFQQQ